MISSFVLSLWGETTTDSCKIWAKAICFRIYPSVTRAGFSICNVKGLERGAFTRSPQMYKKHWNSLRHFLTQIRYLTFISYGLAEFNAIALVWDPECRGFIIIRLLTLSSKHDWALTLSSGFPTPTVWGCPAFPSIVANSLSPTARLDLHHKQARHSESNFLFDLVRCFWNCLVLSPLLLHHWEIRVFHRRAF